MHKKEASLLHSLSIILITELTVEYTQADTREKHFCGKLRISLFGNFNLERNPAKAQEIIFF